MVSNFNLIVATLLAFVYVAYHLSILFKIFVNDNFPTDFSFMLTKRGFSGRGSLVIEGVNDILFSAVFTLVFGIAIFMLTAFFLMIWKVILPVLFLIGLAIAVRFAVRTKKKVGWIMGFLHGHSKDMDVVKPEMPEYKDL